MEDMNYHARHRHHCVYRSNAQCGKENQNKGTFKDPGKGALLSNITQRSDLEQFARFHF